MTRPRHAAMNGMLDTLAPKATEGVCNKCKKTEPEKPTPEQKLKQCSRCHNAWYCSRDCQKADWPDHKGIRCTFGSIRTNRYLDSFKTEDEAFEQIIDSYRLRVEDDYVFRADLRGLYWDADKALPDFLKFLRRAEKPLRERLDEAVERSRKDLMKDIAKKKAKKRAIEEGTYDSEWETCSDSDPDKAAPTTGKKAPAFGDRNVKMEDGKLVLPPEWWKACVLPEWWSAEKRTLCIKRALQKIPFVVEGSDIIEEYNDPLMPMKLRMLAEKIYGTRPSPW